MFVNAKTLAVVVSCALVAHAQSTTATAPASQSSLPAGLDQCILGCVSTAAASNGCGSFTNLTCICTSTAFQQAALTCLQANCTAADIATAMQLQQQQCASLSGNSSTSAPASTAASTSTASRSPTSSSAAMALSAPFSLGGLVGTLVASAGALVGAAFIL